MISVLDGVDYGGADVKDVLVEFLERSIEPGLYTRGNGGGGSMPLSELDTLDCGRIWS